jgi:hypothetical protein
MLTVNDPKKNPVFVRGNCKSVSRAAILPTFEKNDKLFLESTPFSGLANVDSG